MKNKKIVAVLLLMSLTLTGCSPAEKIKGIFEKEEPVPVTVTTIMQNQSHNAYYEQATVKMDMELDFAYNAGLKQDGIMDMLTQSFADKEEAQTQEKESQEESVFEENSTFTDAGNISGVRSLEEIEMPQEYMGSEYLTNLTTYMSQKYGIVYSEQITRVGNAQNGKSIGSTKEITLSYKDLRDNYDYVKKDGLWYGTDVYGDLRKQIKQENKSDDFSFGDASADKTENASLQTVQNPVNLSEEYSRLISQYMCLLPRYINESNTKMQETENTYILETKLDLKKIYEDYKRNNPAKESGDEKLQAFMESFCDKENLIPYGNVMISSTFDKNSFAIMDASINFDNDAITYLDHIFDKVLILDIVFNRCQIKFEYLDKEMNIPISVKEGSIKEEKQAFDISKVPVFRNFN